MAGSTRNVHLDLVKHVFGVAGFNDDEVKYLTETKGIRDPLTLMTIFKNNKEDSYISDSFPEGRCAT